MVRQLEEKSGMLCHPCCRSLTNTLSRYPSRNDRHLIIRTRTGIHAIHVRCQMHTRALTRVHTHTRMPFALLVRRVNGESVTLSDIPDDASVLVLKKMIEV